ncbi:MAG: group III truncated hemoglobin [Saprospiraceae bacterium]|nr:group III truncated hemoglobin [Lewinella sp.]
MKTDIRDRNDIIQLINGFYDKLLEDELMAPLFIDVARINLSEHLPILYDFWESTLFQAGKYRRDAMQPHLDLHFEHRLTNEHFERWLQLFDQTVDELFEGEIAQNAKVRALSIATIIRIKIYNLEKKRLELNN